MSATLTQPPHQKRPTTSSQQKGTSMTTTRTAAATRTAITTVAVTTMLVIALTDDIVTNAHLTWRNRRHNDKAEILDWVVVAAGVVTLAVTAIAWVRPFVMRKLNEIQ